MSRLHVERLQRVEHAPDGSGWLASCRYCSPPLDQVPLRERTWDQTAALLTAHVEQEHPQLVRGSAAA